MAQQSINIGVAPNDGIGDQLRIAFDKSNLNFTELYASVASVEQTRPYASPLGLSNGVTVNLTASPLALTAGDWDICANVNLQITGSTTISNLVMSMSPTSLTFNNVAGFRAENCVPNTGLTLNCTLSPVRISLAGNQNYYLVVNAVINCTSCYAYGIIHARRVR